MNIGNSPAITATQSGTWNVGSPARRQRMCEIRLPRLRLMPGTQVLSVPTPYCRGLQIRHQCVYPSQNLEVYITSSRVPFTRRGTREP